MAVDLSVDDHVVDELVGYTASWTGFNPDAIQRESVHRAVRARLRAGGPGVSINQILQQAAEGDYDLINTFIQDVGSVGETYFFRHPEHYEFLARDVLPQRRNAETTQFRAWSAGCATGEEAYSIAACLLTNLLPTTRIEVLGTDLMQRNVRAAEAGTYGSWSVRSSGPMLYPVVRPGEGKFAIEPSVRQHTHFACHNLLDPPPKGLGYFDLIFCRNVLIYFSPEGMRIALANLASALAPGGTLVCATMDVTHAPVGLVRLGSSELNIFMRPREDAAAKARDAIPAPVQLALTVKSTPTPSIPVARRMTLPSFPPPPAASTAARAPGIDPVPLHLRALVFLERDQPKSVEKILRDLVRAAPDYVPGLFERALYYSRYGEPQKAVELMREVLRRTEPMPEESVVHGPEDLPVSYYRESAKTFLAAGSSRESSADRR